MSDFSLKKWNESVDDDMIAWGVFRVTELTLQLPKCFCMFNKYFK